MNHLQNAIDEVNKQINRLQKVRENLRQSIKEQSQIKDIEIVGLENSEEMIIKTVAEFYRITPHKLMFGGRYQRIAWARHVSIYLIYNLLGRLKIEIAKTFQCDHGTIHHAIKVVSGQIEVSKKVAQEVDKLRRLVNQKQCKDDSRTIAA